MDMRRFIALAAMAPLALAAPGDGTFKSPVPVIESPANGTRFTLEPGTSLEIRVTLPDSPFGKAANIVVFAATSPGIERWHIDVLRRGAGSGEEEEISAYAGPLTALQFGDIVGKRLTTEWFEENGGAGRYRLRAYLSRQVGGGLQYGPSASVDFEVIAPAKVHSSGERS